MFILITICSLRGQLLDAAFSAGMAEKQVLQRLIDLFRSNATDNNKEVLQNIKTWVAAGTDAQKMPGVFWNACVLLYSKQSRYEQGAAVAELALTLPQLDASRKHRFGLIRVSPANPFTVVQRPAWKAFREVDFPFRCFYSPQAHL